MGFLSAQHHDVQYLGEDVRVTVAHAQLHCLPQVIGVPTVFTQISIQSLHKIVITSR